ncbi:unnamed protein product [Bemisia tabaci]|uniref:Pre-mRNA-splicing factor 18 n=1 Tax=Bemisia tabaci TaxID=7038 RepID=A0A9P0ADS3_BEMTA|nr:unnamed protein product [Bemisia tabaci]
MNKLLEELKRKREQLAEKQLLEPGKKYFKRSELLTKEREEYFEKYRASQNNDHQNVEKECSGDSSSHNDPEHQTLSRKEVIRRLRERGEPILLFGETELESFKRLRQHEILEPEAQKGFRNDFQEALEKVDQDYLDEIIASQTKSTNKTMQKDLENVLSYEEIQEEAKTLGKGDRNHDMDVIMHLLQLLLKMWFDKLNTRSGQEKSGAKGKYALAIFTQTQQYLKPLFRKLKTKTLPEDISDSLMEITKHLLNRNYIQASDSYLEMAIGNAPWPIGVTMVGIHARTGREKIFSKNVAHVLNDETQRKFIQALKRLMSRCQEFFPTDPSRCVEYVPPET